MTSIANCALGLESLHQLANTDFGLVCLGVKDVGLGRELHDNAMVGADLPLVARRAELAVLTGAVAAAKGGRGEAVLLIGKAGVGKTRLLIETQRLHGSI